MSGGGAGGGSVGGVGVTESVGWFGRNYGESTVSEIPTMEEVVFRLKETDGRKYVRGFSVRME